jgi:hypothetical protein
LKKWHRVDKTKDGDYDVNEFDRLMDLWTDVSYLRGFAKKNKISNFVQFVNDRLHDAEKIQDLLDDLVENNQPLERYFRPLDNYETGKKILSLQKGKTSNRDGLRIYAIKIDDDCFVITGGAIKMSQRMEDHPGTKHELSKIMKVQDYLKEVSVFDKDSFYEFKSEIE